MPGESSFLLTIFYPSENKTLRGRFEGEASLESVIQHIHSVSKDKEEEDIVMEEDPLPVGTKSKRQSLLWPILGVILLGAGILSLGGIWTYQCYFQHHYSAVFDAGSAHTSLSVYKWHHSHSQKKERIRLIQQDITQTLECESSSDSGVSAYSKDPINVRTYIRESPCFNRSKAFVPPGSHIFFGATAGMRILKALKPQAASAIMSNISVALRDFRNVKATIISGVDEGIYGWIAVNFLSRSFFNGTIGALDWGGASSQITFELKKNALPLISEEYIQPLTLMKKNFSLYVRSDLCYGKFEALRRYLAMLIYTEYEAKGVIPEGLIESPCHAPGRIYSSKDLLPSSKLFSSPCTQLPKVFRRLAKQRKKFSFIGSGKYEECSSRIRLGAFNPKHCQRMFSNHCLNPEEIPLPSSDERMQYIAFSTYYYYFKSLNLLPSPSSSIEYSRLLRDICGVAANNSAPNSCFEGLFLHHLLSDGYHFRDWTQNVTVTQEIQSKEVGWTLGYIIHHSSNEEPELPLLSLPVFILSILDLTLLLVILCSYVIYSRRKQLAEANGSYRPLSS